MGGRHIDAEGHFGHISTASWGWALSSRALGTLPWQVLPLACLAPLCGGHRSSTDAATEDRFAVRGQRHRPSWEASQRDFITEIFNFPQASEGWEVNMQSQALLMRLAGGLGFAGTQTPPPRGALVFRAGGAQSLIFKVHLT